MKLKRTSIAIYVLLIFSSAALVFSVQPIVGRILLPKLGGTTLVWNTCLVFFQATLLLGYLYADILSRKLPLKTQVPIHLGMLALAGLTLPISFPDVSMPSDSLPAIWLLGQLALGVGFPFLVISASAPLFQSWFARTDLPSAENPYYLYAASNLGSILSLVAYPFLIEPRLGVVQQSTAWAFGYAGVGLLIVVAGGLTWKLSEKTGLRAGFSRVGSTLVSYKQMLTWAYLAMIPSALLVAVSAQITADVAPVPFLWMLPLVVFLLTFVIAFARRQFIRPAWLVAIGIPAAIFLAYASAVRQIGVLRSIEFNVLVFFLLPCSSILRLRLGARPSIS